MFVFVEFAAAEQMEVTMDRQHESRDYRNTVSFCNGVSTGKRENAVKGEKRSISRISVESSESDDQSFDQASET